MIFKSIIRGAFLISLSFNTYALPASIIDNGAYTTDNNTSLEWLDFSYTSNVSYNQAINLAGGVQGGDWRYATNQEVTGLFNSFFPNAIYDTHGRSEDINSHDVASFLSFWGTTDSSNTTNYSLGLYIDENNILRNAGIIDNTNSTANDAIVGPDDQHIWDPNQTTPLVRATFLVRNANVPEPSTTALITLGLFTIGITRRKHRA